MNFNWINPKLAVAECELGKGQFAMQGSSDYNSFRTKGDVGMKISSSLIAIIILLLCSRASGQQHYFYVPQQHYAQPQQVFRPPIYVQPQKYNFGQTFSPQPHYVNPWPSPQWQPPPINIRQGAELIYRSGQVFVDPRGSIIHSVVCMANGNCWTQ